MSPRYASSATAPRREWEPPKPTPREELYRARTGWAKAQLDRAIADLAVAEMAGEGVDDKTAALEAAVARFDRMLDKIEQEQRQEAQVTLHKVLHDKAIAALTEGVAAKLAQLKALEGQRDSMFPAAYEAAAGQLRGEIAAADRQAQALFNEYADAALADAKSRRAAAEAGRDPTSRLADLTEIGHLTAGPVNGDEFVARARDMLDGGQPQRAAMFLAVAAAKGARVDELRFDVDAALDVADPDRQRAATLETEVRANADSFSIARKKFLVDGGVGMKQDGSVGSGNREEIAQASVAAKVAAAVAGETSFPVGDGSNTPAETTAAYHQVKSEGGAS